MKAGDLSTAQSLVGKLELLQTFKFGLATWRGDIRITFGGYECSLSLTNDEIYEFVFLAISRHIEEIESTLTKLGIDLEPAP